jgi:hypothetical protein
MDVLNSRDHGGNGSGTRLDRFERLASAPGKHKCVAPGAPKWQLTRKSRHLSCEKGREGRPEVCQKSSLF